MFDEFLNSMSTFVKKSCGKRRNEIIISVYKYNIIIYVYKYNMVYKYVKINMICTYVNINM